MTDQVENNDSAALRAKRNRILFGSMAAIGVMLALLAAVVLAIGFSSDQKARQNGMTRMSGVLSEIAADHLREMRATVKGLKIPLSATANDVDQLNRIFDAALLEALNHNRLLVLSSTGEPLWAGSRSRVGDLGWWSRLPTGLREQLSSPPQVPELAGQVVEIEGRPALLTYVDLTLQESVSLSRARVISVRFIDDETVRLAGRMAGITQPIKLDRFTAASSGASAPLIAHGETPTFWLNWQPEKPSERIRLTLLPAFGFGVLLLVAITMVTNRYLRGSDDELRATQNVASELAEKAERLEHYARQLAYTDAVSGLSNRREFIDRLTELLEDRAAIDDGVVAVFHLDIDRFTEINDSLGHHAGDDVVRAVGERLRSSLTPIDLLARIGDDEFAIARTGISSVAEAEAFLTDFVEIFATPMEVCEMPMVVTCSIGAALAPFHGEDALSIMRHADVALNAGKSRGRRQWTMFANEMVEDARLGLVLETDLRHAIAEDKLTLHYQPQFDAKGSRIIGVEALLRWHHPERGFISPMVFVPIAEERGLAPALGEWVMRRAFTDARNWPGLSVAVNVSPAEFIDPGFLPRVAQLLEESGINPALIELEVTEGVMMRNGDEAGSTINALRKLGVKTALDDFGTGFSSLSYLRRFHFDRLKIDKSFVQEIESSDEATAIVQAIITMAHALNMRVIAEGVETSLQHRFLHASGCDYLQGWLFAKAMDAESLTRLVRGKLARSVIAA